MRSRRSRRSSSLGSTRRSTRSCPSDSPLRGRVAIANARVAYQRYLAKFAGAEWEHLQALGARTQRPLWASTGTKDPAYSDVLYVSELIGPDVVNTMPEQTLRAFADHGEVVRTLDADPEAAERTLAEAHGAGVDLDAVTAKLEREGVQSFCDSYHQLLDCIEGKLGALAPTSRHARSVTLVSIQPSSPNPGRARVLIAGGGSPASRRCWRCARWPPICSTSRSSRPSSSSSTCR